VMKVCCRNYAIDDCQGQTMLLCSCGQMSPAFGNDFGDRQYATSEPRSNINIKPVLQRGTPLADWKRGDALIDFPNRHDAEVYAVLISAPEKCRYTSVGFSRVSSEGILVSTKYPLSGNRSERDSGVRSLTYNRAPLNCGCILSRCLPRAEFTFRAFCINFGSSLCGAVMCQQSAIR